jgi:hypothetical protein
MKRSSELNGACTTATGHKDKEASYEMKITDATGNLEMRVVW